MIYTWYKIFNLNDFLGLELVSTTYSLQLENIGQVDFLITRGDFVSIVYKDTMIPITLNAHHSFVEDGSIYSVDGFAVFLQQSTSDVYLGIEVQGDAS